MVRQTITWMGIEFSAQKEKTHYNVHITMDGETSVIKTKCKYVAEVNEILSQIQQSFHKHHTYVIKKNHEQREKMRIAHKL